MSRRPMQPGDFLELLPPNYVASTSTAERKVHVELYQRLVSREHDLRSESRSLELAEERAPDGTILLHLAFRDRPGSLAAIAASLGELGINLTHVSAFSTSTGVAIDTLSVSRFDAEAAAAIRRRLAQLQSAPPPAAAPAAGSPFGNRRRAASASTAALGWSPPDGRETDSDDAKLGAFVSGSADLVSELPADYLNATTPEERASHQEMYALIRAGTAGDVVLRWASAGDDGDSRSTFLMHVVFIDCLGSLSTITSVLNDRGINIQRVVAFSTNHGVSVDTLQLTLFDQQTADIVEARLAAQIAEEKRIKLTVEAGSSMFSLGHNAVSFTINRAAHLLPRGLGGYYKETLTIGEKWIMYGKHRVEASDFTSVQNDNADNAKLHLCFRQLRRTLTISFPGGSEECRRAYSLLCRVRQQTGHVTTLHDSAAAEKAVGRAPDPRRRDGTFAAMGLPMPATSGVGLHDSQHIPARAPSAAASRLCSARKVMCCLLALACAVGGVYSLVRDELHVGLGEAKSDPASCTVVELAPQLDRVDVNERCRAVAGQTPHCAFFAMTPGWLVDVRLLSRYPHYAHLHPEDPQLHAARTPSYAELDPTRGGERWRAIAVPTVGHSTFRKVAHGRGVVKEGSCSGEVWLSVNETLDFCLSHSADWMPELQIGASYLCWAAAHGNAEVYFDPSTPPSTYAYSVLTVLFVLAAAGGACLCVCLNCRRERSTKPPADFLSGSGYSPSGAGYDARYGAPCSSSVLAGAGGAGTLLVSDDDDEDDASTVVSSETSSSARRGGRYTYLPDGARGSDDAFVAATRAARLSGAAGGRERSASEVSPRSSSSPRSLGRWLHRKTHGSSIGSNATSPSACRPPPSTRHGAPDRSHDREEFREDAAGDGALYAASASTAPTPLARETELV